MLLTLKKIGRIADAEIELNGITVIAGVNDTGKSTVGKVLFCIFNSFYKIDKQIYTERLYSINEILNDAYRNKTNRITSRIHTEEIAKEILDKKEIYKIDEFLLQSFILQSFSQVDINIKKYGIDDGLMKETNKRILQLLTVSDEEIFKTVLQRKFEIEFSGQINNVFFSDESGEISLKIKDTNVKVSIKNDEVQKITNSFSLNTEVIYMDDPFAIDDLNRFPFVLSSFNYLTHRIHLRSKLMRQSNDTEIGNAINEIIATKKINSILQKINHVCSGEMVSNNRLNYVYKRDNL